MTTIKTIGVVGAGTMGNGIAQVFAQSGFDVTLVDIAQPMLERARASIDKSLGKFVEKQKISASDRESRSRRSPRPIGTRRCRACRSQPASTI
jgi:3-hydroxybutyryl-CoA dehydrogenase